MRVSPDKFDGSGLRRIPVSVGIEPPRQPELLELMRQGDEYTLSLYPPESCHLLSIEELEEPGVAVFVARDAGESQRGETVGMAAIVAEQGGVAELKRMFVPADARGRGVGAAILARIDKFATAGGIHTIRLETGPLQPAAIRLYERSGFRLIPNFGKYVGDPNSVCYEKRVG